MTLNIHTVFSDYKYKVFKVSLLGLLNFFIFLIIYFLVLVSQLLISPWRCLTKSLPHENPFSQISGVVLKFFRAWWRLRKNKSMKYLHCVERDLSALIMTKQYKSGDRWSIGQKLNHEGSIASLQATVCGRCGLFV